MNVRPEIAVVSRPRTMGCGSRTPSLPAARQGVPRQQRRRGRRLRRPDREARLPARPRHHHAVAAAVLSSPGRDDGYDISDYGDINPAFGSMRDFRRFMAEAKRRDLRVITELVVNHTSDQHDWFKRAKRSPKGSSARNWYVGATPTRNTRARASSSPTPRTQTGLGTPRRARSTGTASSRTSRT